MKTIAFNYDLPQASGCELKNLTPINLKNFTFRKEERLCNKKLFEQLAATKNSLFNYPFKLVFIEVAMLPVDATVQVAFSVPKRLFKKAVDRNRIKRLIREAYRLNKNELYAHCKTANKKYALLFVYVAKDSPNFNFVQEKLQLLLQRLMSEKD